MNSVEGGGAGQSLEQFLRQYVGKHSPLHDSDLRYAHAQVDLNQDGIDEIIVHLEGRWLCGSGGCPTLVLQQKADSYRLVAEISVTRLPIRVFMSTSNGWRNLGVQVRGGGVLEGYEALLCYDGRTYPSNPTVPPAVRFRGSTAAQVAIKSMNKARSLYP